MKDNKRIVFMGTPEISILYLKTLLKNNFNVVAVYSQPPRSSGRGMILKKSPVEIFARKHDLNVFTPNNLHNKKELDNYKKLKADLTIVMGYGILIPKFFLEQNYLGFLNIHLSLLPKWRGASPIEHALLNGEKNTGVTIFKLTEKLDAGPIIASEKININNLIIKKELQEILNRIGVNLLISILPKYINNNLKLKEQDNNSSSYAYKINSSDTKINFSNSAIDIYNKVRAFSPQPGAWFTFNNERIKIIICEINEKRGKQSSIITENFLIGCKDKSIQPIIIQREGKKLMNIKDFLRGFKFSIGDLIQY